MGAAIGSFIGNSVTRKRLRTIVREVYWEHMSEVRNRVDALDKQTWGHARRWNVSPEEPPDGP